MKVSPQPHGSIDRFSHLPSARLLSDPFRIPLESFISENLHIQWRVEDYQDMHDYASHPSAILTGVGVSVFVKLSEAAHALDQFEVELAGLRLLSERAGVLTPPPIGIQTIGSAVIFALQAVQAVPRRSEQWRDIGRTLARIHQAKETLFGLERQGYFGPLYQDNRPSPDWPSFYLERRIWPRFMAAIDSGFLPTQVIRQIDRLIQRFPNLDLPDEEPCLLHGDAQQNNFISTPSGAMVIDPAVYYGNPEVDLAYIDYFQDVPEDVFSGYREILPIDPGFPARKDLWRISAYLAAVMVEGTIHLEKLIMAVQKYL